MKENMLYVLNIMLDNLHKDNKWKHSKEELLTCIIRKVVLEKYNISFDTYINFLYRCFGDIEEIVNNKILLEGMTVENLRDLDLLSLCSILDEYLSDENRYLTGSYYTPNYIIKFMVSNSLKCYLEENTEINSNSIDMLIDNEIIYDISNSQLLDLLEIFDNLKIIDISCGSGLFLDYFFAKIYSIKKIIYKEFKRDFDEYLEKKSILEKNIFGIDIQQMPLEMVALKFIDILANYKNFNIDHLNINLYKKNSILGNEIFKAKNVNEVIEKGGFDIVIGNPPYLGEKGNKDLFEAIKKYQFGEKYYEAKMDYFYYFIYRGVDILKDKGILSYITTNYFITADGARGLRKFLKGNVSFKYIINFNEYEVFKAAKGQHNMIFTLAKGFINDSQLNIKYLNKSNLTVDDITKILNDKEISNEKISSYKIVNQNSLYGLNGNIMIFPKKGYTKIISKIRQYSQSTLGDICNINQGIVSGADKVTRRMIDKKLKTEDVEKNNIYINKGIFVLSKEEIIHSNIEKCRQLKPFYKNSDVRKYYTNDSEDKYILYLTDSNINFSDYCVAIQEHLIKFKDVLSLRRETKKGIRNWFALQWSREQRIFEGPKIVVPQRALQNNFGYNEGMWYASADVYFITPKKESVDLKLLLGILNSKIMYFWLYNMGKRKGDYLELYSTPLAQIPINLNLSSNIKVKVINIVNQILSQCKNEYDNKFVEEYQNKIDSMLYRTFNFSAEEIKEIEELYFSKKK